MMEAIIQDVGKCARLRTPTAEFYRHIELEHVLTEI